MYFNILVGEILSHLALTIAPLMVPAAVIGLELFVAVVQAYIFAILSAVYIALMSETHDDHAHSEPHAAQTPAALSETPSVRAA